MDKLKKARKPLRSSISRTINEADVEMAKQHFDHHLLQVKSKKLADVYAEVMNFDQQILAVLLDNNCSDEDYDVEFALIEEYQDKVREMRIKIENVISNTQQLSITPSFSTELKAYRLPKFEIRKFNGDLTEWLSFWSQFIKVHEDEKLHDADKFQYLAQSMVVGTRAHELVQSYPQTADNYPKVITALRERFGRKKLLRQVYVRELLKMVINNTRASEKTCLSKMHDKLVSHLRALESLGVTVEVMAEFLYPMVESSLPEEVLIAWQRSPLYGKDGATEVPSKTELDYLMQFLCQEVESEEQRTLARAGFGALIRDNQKNNGKGKNHMAIESVATAAGLLAGNSEVCIFCVKNHKSSECLKAQVMSLEDKRQKVQEKNVCYSCLRSGHPAKKCKVPVRCMICTRKHHTVMCPDLAGGKKSDGFSDFPEEKVTPQAAMTSQTCTGDVLLKTEVVRMVGRGGKSKVVRLVYDSGNQRSYVRKTCLDAMNLIPIGEEVIRKCLFGGAVTGCTRHYKYQLQLESLDGNHKGNLIALDEKLICGPIPSIPQGPWIQEFLHKKVQFSDMASEHADVDILVGNDYHEQFLTGKRVQLVCGLTAVQTVFGWTLSGRVPVRQRKAETIAMTVTSLFASEASPSTLWSLETLGIRDPVESKSKEEVEKAIKEQFQSTVIQKGDGRYVVKLPWNNGEHPNTDNRNVAEKRLRSTTDKLKRDGKFEDYNKVFNCWLEEGLIEEVRDIPLSGNYCHYMPHRAVFKPESLTTPIRPVFDASCKTGRNPSLNDCLEKGPNFIELLPAILLRFREKKVGVISDIRKAFQMIEVNEEDCNFLRFLWWNDEPTGVFKIFRHRRVVFGVNCSPFLLGAVIDYHLNAVKDGREEIAKKLLKSFYVDNCVTSVDSHEEYEVFKKQASELMAEARMELCQWSCNFGADSRQSTMVLGLNWNQLEDTLNCIVAKGEMPQRVTKRSILSQIQRLFDPIGFLCPALVIPKMLMQKSWSLKTTWDEKLPEDICTEFGKWLTEAAVLEEIRIPRDVSSGTASQHSYQLHIFCDASRSAYAAVAFLRVDDGQHVSVQLLQAKSRVSPLKPMTIPRLELIACTIAARLAKTVKEAMSLADVPIFFWSDSSTALAWIKRNDDWGTFVGNRVKEICQLSSENDWHHVPGVYNPADLPSRGCTPHKLLESRWWEGPDWLRYPQSKWPVENVVTNEEAVLAERKKSAVNNLVSTKGEAPWYLRRFSSYNKNIRVIAWIRRFLANAQKKGGECGDLTVAELKMAETNVFQMVQQEVFSEEKEVISGLRVQRDQDGLIRVKTKLLNREDTKDFRLPILLPHDHPIVDQLIRDTHLSNGHAGVQYLMGKLRERCWIVQGRRALRRVLSKCVKCLRFTSKPRELVPASLPEDRVKDAKVFQVVGIDLAGPLFLKDGTKAWIVLFTCAIYRCVHLELVTSLSTVEFLWSFQRFIDRRGRPETVYSDNGTNFVGAVNVLESMDWNRIEKEARVKNIKWKFNPPTASWWGGWWESLIRLMKDLLKRILGRAKVGYEELHTILCQVEAILNDRPLTYVTEDAEDLIPLTPAMFLQEVQEVNIPELDEMDAEGMRRRYHYQVKLREEFRARFRKEYLAQLVQRGRQKTQVPFQLGEVVLVGADNKKRQEWPMAIIVQLLPGVDGIVRVVRVKCGQSVLLRPVQRLYPLEVTSTSNYAPLSAEVKQAAKVLTQQNREVTLPTTVTRYGRRVKEPKRLGY